ncbi:hypothetical protein ACFC6U_13520 [Kitasatospora purpeofusca]|uniref:hypothetical protein n=1 Tax=Kitasatospora purpeofusca TaxID=67352 RepID=UPI0035DFD38C
MRPRSPRRTVRRTATAVAALLAAGMPAVPAHAAAGTSILFDPGPRARCFSTVREFYGVARTADPANHHSKEACGLVDLPGRGDSTCAPPGFPYQGAAGPQCPAWDFVTVNWNGGDFGHRPGYTTAVADLPSGGLALTLDNNSAEAGDCLLHEASLSYQYPSSSLRRRPDGSAYGLGDGHLRVGYTVRVELRSGFHCAERRAILTTDLVYLQPDGRKNVISVIAHDPGASADPTGPDRVTWDNHCAGDGCRVMVLTERPLSPGVDTRVDIDFTDLASRLRGLLGGRAPDLDSRLIAVQIVNSTRGADLRATVSGVDAVITP